MPLITARRIANPLQLDVDGDSIGDVCDPTPGCGGCGQPACEHVDTDNDGIQDYVDNCPNIYNPQQLDANGDGIGRLLRPNTRLRRLRAACM